MQLAHWINHLGNDASEHLPDDANALARFGINTTSRGITLYWNKLHFLAHQAHAATSSAMLMYSFSNPPPPREYWMRLQASSVATLNAAQALLSTGNASLTVIVNLSSASADSPFHGKPGSVSITMVHPFSEDLDASELKTSLIASNALYKTASSITDYITSRMGTATLRQKWADACARDGTLLLMLLILKQEQYAKDFGNVFEKQLHDHMHAGITCAQTECYLRYVELTDMFNSALPTSRRLTDSIIASKLEDAAIGLGSEMRTEVRANAIAKGATGDRAKIDEVIQLAIGLVETESSVSGRALLSRPAKRPNKGAATGGREERPPPPWETRAFDGKKDRPCPTCQGAHWRVNCDKPQPDKPVRGAGKLARSLQGIADDEDAACESAGDDDDGDAIGTFMEQLRDVVPQMLADGADAPPPIVGRSLVARGTVRGRGQSDGASESGSEDEDADDPRDDTPVIVDDPDVAAPLALLGLVRAYGITVGPDQGIVCGTWDAPDFIRDKVNGVSARPGVPVTLRIKTLPAALTLSRQYAFRSVNAGPRAFLGVAAGEPIPGATAEDIARVPPLSCRGHRRRTRSRLHRRTPT